MVFAPIDFGPSSRGSDFGAPGLQSACTGKVSGETTYVWLAQFPPCSFAQSPSVRSFLLSRHRQRRIYLNFSARLFLRPSASGRSCIGPIQAALLLRAFSAGLPRSFFLNATHRGQHHRHHMFQIPWIAPIEPKDLRKKPSDVRDETQNKRAKSNRSLACW